MPLIEIKALPQRTNLDIPTTIAKVAAELAELLHLPPEKFWVTWQVLHGGHYTIGKLAPPLQPYNTHPPIVTVYALAGLPQNVIELILKRLGKVLSTDLQIDPANIHIMFVENVAGRVYSGGQIVLDRPH
jgi:phenylpyruvate tautomerase PptA (4-oxalocrotonate tautomerase family)